MDRDRLRNAAKNLLSPRAWAWRHAARSLGPGFSADGDTYRDLSEVSLLFSHVITAPGARRLNLVVPTAEPSRVFAGAKTALSLAGALASHLGLPLRIITMDPWAARAESELSDELIPAEYEGPQVLCFNLGSGASTLASDRDLWIVTHWTTAHAADVACRVGSLDPQRVFYFVQDYEPGFEPWSTNFALIRATYHAGFRIVVNSRPLAEHLGREERLLLAEELILAPKLDLDRLQEVSRRRVHKQPLGIFFYARPTKPRNLYPLGVAALRRAARLLGADAAEFRFYTAGEQHAPFSMPREASLKRLGQTGWNGYFELLTRVHVGLSLMYSPHPSHPPLELAISGARVITNRFASARDDLHPAVRAVEADPDSLGSALAQAAREVRDSGPLAFSDVSPGSLGRPFLDVVRAMAHAYTN